MITYTIERFKFRCDVVWGYRGALFEMALGNPRTHLFFFGGGA